MKEMRRGPVAAKTYGGTSWSFVQSKVSKAQKINGFLNVFGIYNHTNNQMWTHSPTNKRQKENNSLDLLHN